MKANLKSVLATAFLLICSISTINAQNNHQFSYQLREDGTHIYMSDESEFKIVEIDQREEIIYQGDFSLAYMEKDGYIAPVLFFIFSHDAKTIFGPSKVDIINKYKTANVEIKLSNGEVLGNNKKNIGKISQGYGALNNVSITIDPLQLYSNKHSSETGKEHVKYIMGQLSKFDIVSIKIGDVSFNYDRSDEDRFRTATIIKGMMNDLRTKVKNKNSLAY